MLMLHLEQVILSQPSILTTGILQEGFAQNLPPLCSMYRLKYSSLWRISITFSHFIPGWIVYWVEKRVLCRGCSTIFCRCRRGSWAPQWNWSVCSLECNKSWTYLRNFPWTYSDPRFSVSTTLALSNWPRDPLGQPAGCIGGTLLGRDSRRWALSGSIIWGSWSRRGGCIFGGGMV